MSITEKSPVARAGASGASKENSQYDFTNIRDDKPPPRFLSEKYICLINLQIFVPISISCIFDKHFGNCTTLCILSPFIY